MTTSRQIVLAKRPDGHAATAGFRQIDAPIPTLGEGEIQLKTLAISIDPTIRGWLDDRPSYLPPIAMGDPVRSFGLARVVASRNDAFPEGTIVRGFVGWQEEQVVPGRTTDWEKITPLPGVALEHYLGVLGMTGLTAWIGVEEILQPEPGQTVLVSGASGAVGTVAVQLAKLAGARVVGIAGGPSKGEMLLGLGADDVIDRNDPNWRTHFKQAFPDGIDGLFENSGGPMFEAAIRALNNHSRIALCGLIDGYNLDEAPTGPRNLGLLITKRVMVQGFIVMDYMHRTEEIESYLGNLITNGDLKTVQTVLSGFEQLPDAFVNSFSGGHSGKLIVKLD